MKTFVKGQRAKLADITQSTAIEVSLNIGFPVQKVIDYGCFGVDKNNKLSDDRYFIFYNQKQSPDNALELLGSKFGDTECFKIDLTKLPNTIAKLVFTATLDDEGVISEMKQGHIRLFANSKEFAKFAFTGADFNEEKAIIIAELYLTDSWRFSAVGQGFNGGLSQLLNYFGGQEATTEQPAKTIENTEQPLNPVNSGIQLKSQNSCSRCGKKRNLLNILAFNKKTGRCNKCESELENALNNFRMAFINYCEDGILTNQEWNQLQQLIERDRLNREESLDFVRGDALNFLERTLTLAFADGILTEQEEKDFYQLKDKLAVPENLAAPLIKRLLHLKEITKIREGHLPTIKTTVLLDSQEICHLEESATYYKVNAKTIQPIAGRLTATNKQLYFNSPSDVWKINITNIMRIEEFTDKINLELAIKKGNGSYAVDDPLKVSAVIDALTRIHKRQLLQPQTERASRSIPHHIRISVYNRDQGKCVQCHASEYLEYDHIIPYSKGGASTEQNIQLLCRKCNLAKGARI